MATSFKELLGKKADDAKPQPAYPAGTYYGKLGKYTFGDQNKNKTPYVRFNVTATGLGEDVDEQEFNQLGIKLGEKQFRLDFFLTDEADYRLKDFIQSLGIETAGKTFNELLPDLPGSDIMFQLSMQAARNPDGSDAEDRFVNFITTATGMKE